MIPAIVAALHSTNWIVPYVEGKRDLQQCTLNQKCYPVVSTKYWDVECSNEDEIVQLSSDAVY